MQHTRTCKYVMIHIVVYIIATQVQSDLIFIISL